MVLSREDESLVADNIAVLVARVPAGLPLSWILDGEDHDGTARETDAYLALEADPKCAWSLGWLAGKAEALGMTRLELLDAAGVGWTEVVREDDPPERTVKVAVDCLAVEYGGVLYGAGVCYVRLGGSRPICAVACRAGEKRRIVPPEDAAPWLVEAGLPKLTARALVRDALKKKEVGG